MRKCQYQPCSKPFSGRSDKKYCSKTCRTYASHGDTTVPGWRERARIANAPKSKIYIKTCPLTGLLFIARYKHTTLHPTIDTRAKHKLTYQPKPKNTLICTDCNNTFQSHKTPSHCPQCRELEARRILRSKRRAIIRNVAIERVSPYKVFKRDKWTCQICGTYTPADLRGKALPNSPELDHIIPLSKGGEHSYKNTQCLCRSCNGKKADKTEYYLVGRVGSQFGMDKAKPGFREFLFA